MIQLKPRPVSARNTVRETLSRCRDAVRRGIGGAELDALLAAAVEALEHRQETRERLAKLRRLERQLAHLSPGERAAAIRQRMGISRSGYYKLRALALSPRANVDSGPV